MPEVTKVTSQLIAENFARIKKDMAGLVQTEIERMLDTPELGEKIVRIE